MIGKILGAVAGRKLAGEGEEGKGTVIGFLAPALLKRVAPAIAVTVAAGWAAKKLLSRRRDRASA